MMAISLWLAPLPVRAVETKLTALDGALNDSFGFSVSVSGDTALVGAPRNDGKGSAYVFVPDNTGGWSEQTKLTASDGGALNDRFGISVSVSGDTALVGAFLDDNDNGSGAGSAYVFVRDANTRAWSEQAKLLASDGAADDQFGFSVSVNGETALVGAYSDDDNGLNSGSAYVFVRDAAGAWIQQQKLTASDGEVSDQFGISVYISMVCLVATFEGPVIIRLESHSDTTGIY